MKFEFRFNFSVINSVNFSVLVIFLLIPDFLIKVNATEIVLSNKNEALIEKNFKTEDKNSDKIKLSENNNFNQIIEKFDKNLSYNNNNNKILNDKIESVTTDSDRKELSVSDERNFNKNPDIYGKYGGGCCPPTTTTITNPETTTDTQETIDKFYVTSSISDIEDDNKTKKNRCLLESAQNFLSTWLADNGTLIHTRRIMGKTNVIKSDFNS